MNNKFLPILIFLFYTSIIKAQFGAQIGATFLYSGGVIPTLGLHVNGIQLKSRNIYQGFQFGLNWHLPLKIEGHDYINPIDPTIVGIKNEELKYKDHVNGFDIYAFYRYYFWGQPSKSGTIFVLFGGTLGLSFSRIEPDLSSFNSALYKLSSNFNTLKHTNFQPSINLGVGYENELKNKHVFGVQFLIYSNPKYYPRDVAIGDHAQPLVSLKVTYSLPPKATDVSPDKK